MAILFIKGIDGARKYSEHCSATAKLAPTWDGLDKCIAFDFAAAHLDESISKELKASVNSYFQFRKENASQLYEAAGVPAFSFSSRLAQLQTSAEQAADEALEARVIRERMKQEAAKAQAEKPAVQPAPTPDPTWIAPNGEVRKD